MGWTSNRRSGTYWCCQPLRVHSSGGKSPRGITQVLVASELIIVVVAEVPTGVAVPSMVMPIAGIILATRSRLEAGEVMTLLRQGREAKENLMRVV